MHYDMAHCDVMQSGHNYNVAMHDRTLSTVNLMGEKFTFFHKYVQYFHNYDMTSLRDNVPSNIRQISLG